MSLNELKAIFAKYNLRPKKRLGQHFLIDDNILDKIIACAGLAEEDIVVEIGAGAGDIALKASPIARRVVAVEKDRLMCRILEDRLKVTQISTDEKLTDAHRLELVCKDILKLDLAPVFGADRSVKVVGNLPYYITTPIIFKLLEYKKSIQTIFITVQEEVADRITAAPGSKEYGILSCALQYHTRPRFLFRIGREMFWPAPEVDSAFVRLDILKSPAIEVRDERLFFEIIKAGFNQRRKTLSNSLSNLKITDKDAIASILQKEGIALNRRAETLSLGEFARIANALYKK